MKPETVTGETAKEKADEKALEESPAVDKTPPETTSGRPESARTRRGAHARGSRIGRGTIWKAVFAIALLALLATAVTIILLQSAGIISWGFLGPNA